MLSRPTRRALALGVLALLAAPEPYARGDELPADVVTQAPWSPTHGYSLDRILELADQNYPTLAQSRAKVREAQAQLDEAHYAPYSQFRFTGGIGLAPTIRGSSTFSPNTDVSLTSSLGLAWRAGIEGVVPLWTFGKITNLWDAAKSNVRVNQAQVEADRDAIRLDVRRAFFGLQLARDSQYLLRDARKSIDKATARLEEEVADANADEIDLEKIQTFAAELDVREAEADKYVSAALAGLRFYSGVPNLDIVDSPLRAPKHELGHLLRYLQAAKLYRPELRMASAGIDARTAQVRLARSMLFPDIGVGLSAGLSTAPEIADQINPFVTDPGNYFHYGAALVFQWKLDFLPQAARIRFAQAQLDQVQAQQRYALGGVGSEVELAYADVVDWTRRRAAYQRAVKHAKRWLIIVQEGIDVGTKEEKELLEPARQYAFQRFNLLNATMELNLAMSRLSKATGWNAIAPDGT
jgi:outer membrane protein TolC